MAALLIGIGPAKGWEEVRGDEGAEGSAGRDGAVWGTEPSAESGLCCWPAAADFKPGKTIKEG